MTMHARDWLTAAPVVPVLTLTDAEDAVPLARALVAGGLKVLEITLRTPVALEAIRRIAGEVPDAIVTAGTVLTERDLYASAEAGARMCFSPGLADFMLQPGPIPVLPGVSTASEVMRAAAFGLQTLKFFPAVPAGGTAVLKALHAPLPSVAFCPTGGIDAANAASFLALPNVLCVGGSWVAPPQLVARKDWMAIQSLARTAVDLPVPTK